VGEYRDLLKRLVNERSKGPTVIGGMIPHPDPVLVRDSIGFIDENLGDLSDFPASRFAVSYIADRLSNWMFRASYPGMATSGGSEANTLAGLLARSEGARKIVAFETAHYSVWKAADLLGLEKIVLPVENGYNPNLEILEETVDDETLLVLTVGTTETGFIDPILDASRIACSNGGIVHIDGAFAGIIQSYLDPYKIPRKLDGCVRTYSVDLHKIPEAPAPSGFILASDEEVLEGLYYKAEYIPSGRQFGLLGTRPGWTVIAGALSLARIEDKGGIERIARLLLDSSKEIAEGLKKYGYSTPHKVETPILCLLHSNIDEIVNNLSKAGYSVYRCMKGRGIRLAVTPWLIREYSVDGVIELLGEAAEATF
jgi:tyrosine decarboxylase/aspartate 1-decarboxylase